MPSVSLHDIKNGLDRDEFHLFYQPKVSLNTGLIVGAEALLRWTNGGTLIMPKDFIPLSERTGFVSILTERVFDLLSRDARALMDHQPNLKIALNVSPHDFQKNRVVEYLEKLEKTNSIAPGSLQLEITEETATTATTELVSVMNALTEYGVLFSLDDFGTGFSSLEVLSQLPFSEIKIDQSLVRQVGSNPKAKSIVAATIRMANRLNMHTVGEGIETEASFEQMAFAGCEIAQGYWISRPLPLPDFLEFIGSRQHWPCNVAGLLYQAQMDHIQWRHDLIDLYYRIKNGTVETESELGADLLPRVSDHHSCKLGKWYEGAGRIYADMSEFSDIDTPHKHFHEIGARLLKMALDSDFENCKATLKELSTLSTTVLGCLHNLEDAIQHKE